MTLLLYVGTNVYIVGRSMGAGLDEALALPVANPHPRVLLCHRLQRAHPLARSLQRRSLERNSCIGLGVLRILRRGAVVLEPGEEIEELDSRLRQKKH